MKGLFLLFFIFLSMGLYADDHANDRCKHLSHTFRCVEVARIYDGDSIKVNIPNLHVFFAEEMSVRVTGIDTAEKYGKSPCEREMAALARNFIYHRISMAKDRQSVELRSIKKDKYFRLNAQVWVNGYSIGNALIKESLAVEYDGGTKADVDWCQLKESVPGYIIELDDAPAY
ncbi:MAG: thermonuclease family protein [Bacteriovoracaceae bacterium]